LLSLLFLSLFLPVAAAGPDRATADKEKKEPLPAVLEKAAVPETVNELRAIQEQAKKVYEKVMAATVCVRIGQSSGSGVIVSAEGHVLTAAHVSGEADRPVEVILHDGRKVKGKTLCSNRAIDSGMIKITDEGKWTFADLGKSADLKKGQWCVTLGHPRGYIPGRKPVLRLGRVLESNGELIQTDCAIVGGDSGGPLFDMTGKVIGIHSRIGPFMTNNIHVPADTYTDTWDRLVKAEVWGGRLGGGAIPVRPTPYLGVQIDRDSDEMRVVDVVKDSPAEKAGVKVKDLLAKLDGQKIANLDELGVLLAKKKVGDTVTLEVKREDKLVALKVTLAKRPE